MSHSQQPCAACKLQRRKCTQECIFAPHFPPDQPQKFADIHKVFGASNVAKLLSELPTMSREEAVISLSYEAGARIRDPVYGCVGAISELQHRLKQMHMEIDAAKQELLKYMGGPNHNPQQNQGLMIPNLGTAGNNPATAAFIAPAHHQNQQNMMMQMIGGGHQMLEAQLLATELQQPHQEMFRVYDQREHQHHNHNQNHNQQDVIGFSSGNGIMDDHVADSVTANNGFNQISGVEVEPCLALGSMDGHGGGSYNNEHHTHHHHQQQQQVNHEQSQVEIPAHQEQLFFHSDLNHEQDLNHHQSSGSDEGGNSGPPL
ncbi:LOB domain-containing protein 36 [Linum perenne]